MRNKIFKIYLIIFMFIIFLTSALFIYEQINKLNLPKGIISIVISYGYFIIHLFSFLAMIYYGKKIFMSFNKND